MTAPLLRALVLTSACITSTALHASTADPVADALIAINSQPREWWGTEYEPPAYRVSCVRQLAAENPQAFRAALWNTRNESKRLRSLALEVEAYLCIDAAQK
jgi:hypothetical protein